MANPLNILVVDDDRCVHEALSAVLQPTYKVHFAFNGAEACTKLLDRHFSAIILDAVLQNEHGIDLLPRVRELTSAPVIMLTGYSTEDLAIRSVRAGISDYLKKPLSVTELHEAISRAIFKTALPTDVVVQLRHHLDMRFSEAFDLSRFAEEVGCSAAHLRRLFRLRYGFTPRQHLTRIRLERAKALLESVPTLGIEQIALTVGFSSCTLFDRIFRSRYKVAPSDYRRATAR